MYAFFNTLGQLTFVSESVIQGSEAANNLYASFENKTWTNYPIATITFRRDDGTTSPEIQMTQHAFTYNSVNYSNGFLFNFYDEWFTAIAGKLEATIRLYGQGGVISAQGLITIEVQSGVAPAYVDLEPEQYQEILSLISEAYNDIESLHFDETFEPGATTSGDFYYDETTTRRTLTYIHTHENGQTQQIPLGQVLYGIGKNTSGSQILKGQPACWSGVQGNHPTFQGASASAATPLLNEMVGVTDTTTANNDYGPVVVFGIVTGVNMNTIMEDVNQLPSLEFGSKLYVSATTPGTYTINEPVRPNASVWAATIISLNLNNYTNAVLFVHVQRPRTASGGVDIQATEEQPQNQITGDFWFDID
jgi:hypothetical protein